jgi:hypothetical protein
LQAHSLAPLLLDADTLQPATREKVEEVVQVAIASRGIDYSIDSDDQLALSLLASQLHREQVLHQFLVCSNCRALKRSVPAERDIQLLCVYQTTTYLVRNVESTSAGGLDGEAAATQAYMRQSCSEISEIIMLK